MRDFNKSNKNQNSNLKKLTVYLYTCFGVLQKLLHEIECDIHSCALEGLP